MSHRPQEEVNAEIYGELSTNLFKLEKVCPVACTCTANVVTEISLIIFSSLITSCIVMNWFTYSKTFHNVKIRRVRFLTEVQLLTKMIDNVFFVTVK